MEPGASYPASYTSRYTCFEELEIFRGSLRRGALIKVSTLSQPQCKATDLLCTPAVYARFEDAKVTDCVRSLCNKFPDWYIKLHSLMLNLHLK